MIVETSLNDATGSSGFAAYALLRSASPDCMSLPQRWQKCETSGTSELQRGHSTPSSQHLTSDRRRVRAEGLVRSLGLRPGRPQILVQIGPESSFPAQGSPFGVRVGLRNAV